MNTLIYYEYIITKKYTVQKMIQQNITPPFEAFKSSLNQSKIIEELREGLIGDDVFIPGMKGPNKLIYADYVASGRAVQQIENFILHSVLPYYSNSHTEASYCGAYISRLRLQAREEIAACCKANSDYSVIFTGSGATAGINRLVHLFGIKKMLEQQQQPLVLIGPYEHHSNILPWRESGAEIIEIKEGLKGGPDLEDLEAHINRAQGRPIIGAFSAMSNVTGIATDVKKVTQLLNKHKVKSVWDFAGAGPYVPIDLSSTDGQIDAIVTSPHKFIGGPSASGVLIIRNAACTSNTPSLSGGGTVKFVSPWSHDYSDSLIAREEAGTPNIIGDIRAGLVFALKQLIGEERSASKQKDLFEKAYAKWSQNPNIELLGNPDSTHRLPVFSFRIKAASGAGYIHQQLFTRMLSDIYGIQARGGCACAGPYAHRLMKIEKQQSEYIRAAILKGEEMTKPGWVRLNLSILLTEEKTDFIINSVDELARDYHKYIDAYNCDESTARFQLAS